MTWLAQHWPAIVVWIVVFVSVMGAGFLFQRRRG